MRIGGVKCIPLEWFGFLRRRGGGKGLPRQEDIILCPGFLRMLIGKIMHGVLFLICVILLNQMGKW